MRYIEAGHGVEVTANEPVIIEGESDLASRNKIVVQLALRGCRINYIDDELCSIGFPRSDSFALIISKNPNTNQFNWDYVDPVERISMSHPSMAVNAHKFTIAGGLTRHDISDGECCISFSGEPRVFNCDLVLSESSRRICDISGPYSP